MNAQIIDDPEDLAGFIDRLRRTDLICFDTEFVAEDAYRPELCLIQVAAEDMVAIIDPFACGPLEEFWLQIVDPAKTIVVHAGREECLFAYRSTGQMIPGLFDVQLAAGFLGHEYPISYGNLVAKLVGIQLEKGETRSDWRHRPLSERQLAYAVQDVHDLPEIYRIVTAKLKKSGRLEWFEGETQLRQDSLFNVEQQEQWHRMSGVQSLTPKSLATAAALWRWRDAEAKRRDMPPRRILRDDLLVELARRRSTDVRRIASLRGMQHGPLKNYLNAIAEVIARSADDPTPDWPQTRKNARFQPAAMLTQFLAAALASICHRQHIAASLVGTAEDLRDFIDYRLYGRGDDDRQLPSLLQGWRAEIVGNTLDDLLSGKAAITVANPKADVPLRVS